jgi:1-acyl-sn-glycerol-3-phosphate acyltransferase
LILFRSILFNVLFYLNLAVLLCVAIPSLAMPHWAPLGMAKLWGRTTLWLLRVVCRTQVEWRGLDKIPPGGILIAAKHHSTWETFALVTVLDDPTFIIKRELLWIPLFGWLAWRAGMIPINRRAGKAAMGMMTAHALKAIAEGRQIVIFPEAPAVRPGRRRATRSGWPISMRPATSPACRSRSIPACSGRAAVSGVFPGRCRSKCSTPSRPAAAVRTSLPNLSTTSKPQPPASLPTRRVNSAPTGLRAPRRRDVESDRNRRETAGRNSAPVAFALARMRV